MSIEDIHVKQVYNKISNEFNHTRYRPWTCVEKFLNSVEVGSIIGDIGCGNARILNSISNHSKYLGIDICEDLISFCETNFKNDNKSSFLAMDIEKYRWPKKLKEYDVAYLDSTFTMMEKPQFLYKRLIKTFKTIFFNRTPIENYSNIEIAKVNHTWEGMDKGSPLWKFTPMYFSNFCDSYGGECRAYPEDIIIYERNKIFEDIVYYD